MDTMDYWLRLQNVAVARLGELVPAVVGTVVVLVISI